MRSYYEQVPIYTTRSPKKGDTEPYIHVSQEAFDAMVKSGEIIARTQMESKTELRKYGYRKQDIEAIWAKAKLPIVVTDIHLLKGQPQCVQPSFCRYR
jgi:guanylate kinase